FTFLLMYDSKLFQLLATLSSKEMTWLHKFLKSPYFNTHEQYTRLFEYIKKYHPNLAHRKLKKETVFQHLYPDTTAFQPQTLRKLMYELTALVEEFLVIHTLKNDTDQQETTLIAELGRRNLYKVFKKRTEKQLEVLDQKEQKEAQHFLDCYHLKKQLLEHALTTQQRATGTQILRLSADLDTFYFWQKLRLAANFESGRRIYAVDMELPFIQEIIQVVEAQPDTHILEIELYLLIYKMLKSRENDALFKQAYTAFLASEVHLSKTTKNVLLQYLINYATYRLNKGEQAYTAKNFELYKIGLQSDLFLKDGHLSNNAFSNVVGSGAFLKAFEWVENFMTTYADFLPQATRTQVLNINHANLAFQKGNFERTIDLLSTTHFEALLYDLQSRLLRIKAHVELYAQDESQYDLVIAQLEAFQKFLYRNQRISEATKQSLHHFIKMTTKLMRFYQNPTDAQKIYEVINQVYPLSNKPWLLSKVEEMRY
ncbi:MAG: hypothetical protein AAGI23_18010, partial [Bacteroidota bacterium]